MTVKLSLDWKSLEKLVVDREFELSLSKQIVHEFSKRHLRAVAETAAYREASAEVIKELSELIKTEHGISNILSTNVWPTINSRIKELIESHVKEVAVGIIEKKLTAVLEQKYFISSMESYIDKVMKRELDVFVTKAINERLQAVAKSLANTPLPPLPPTYVASPSTPMNNLTYYDSILDMKKDNVVLTDAVPQSPEHPEVKYTRPCYSD